ncbi:hypothetical protein CPC16_008876 [Podila verticillata]|nr:hypothetical protein BGZ59_000723 [Podila verticillata]KAF9383530.1 hypothetical protein CPC16_008876 [Podila verticillata]
MRTGFISALALAAVSIVSAAPIHDHKQALENMEKRLSPVNDWNCKPDAVHPVPLVLVHATFPTAAVNWAYHGTRFTLKGYCVFQLDYGHVPQLPGIGGMGLIENSAQQLKTFVDQVLNATGTSKMPLYWMKRLGGADKVRRFGALAPATHGTDLSGIVTLGRQINLYDPVTNLLNKFCAACMEMVYDSSFMQALFADGDTVPNVEYLMLATNYDEVITPYTRSWLRDQNPLVKNKKIQDYCMFDITEHIGMFANSLAFNIMDDFFTPSTGTRMLNCLTYVTK